VVGRGTVIADTTVAALLATAAGDQVRLRTTAAADAAAVLEAAGATVAAGTPVTAGATATAGAADGADRLTISGLPAARVVALLSAKAVPFSEVAARRATLEQAYMELTRDATVYRAAGLVTGPADGTGHGPAHGPADGTVTR
jgi:ABC-2 type transport system ATP-binding protein